MCVIDGAPQKVLRKESWSVSQQKHKQSEQQPFCAIEEKSQSQWLEKDWLKIMLVLDLRKPFQNVVDTSSVSST